MLPGLPLTPYRTVRPGNRCLEQNSLCLTETWGQGALGRDVGLSPHWEPCFRA